jgi:Ca2+/Na+ antiporter
LTYLRNLTSTQLVFTTIYLLFFILIIKTEKTLWYILALFYLILILFILYNTYYKNTVYENFETKNSSSSTKPNAPAHTTTSSTPASKPIIPVTNEAMTSSGDIDEWSEEEKRKIQGLISVPTSSSGSSAESVAEKERMGITFVSADNKSGNIDLTPAVAQRETYKLIDAVQQLQEVMSNLSPTLREGKKIIDMFDKLKK